MELDFAGSAAQHDGNLNCPLAVTLSACYFALRVLTDPDVPPCAGAYRPLTVIAPEGSLLNARPPAAVAAGNVETSSRVADLVLRRLRARARPGHDEQPDARQRRASPTTRRSAAARARAPDADGPSAVHVAMSNTLNTPIEALELEFPLRAVEYSLRRGSGGAGRHRGGDGVVRELEALDAMRYSLITERRRHAPPGADGGEPGAPGRNLLNGEELPPKASGTLDPGDRLRIETPGGGGHGRMHSCAHRAPGRTGGLLRPRNHGRADGREPGAGRLRAVRLEPHAREGGALRGGARRARRGDPARGGRGRRGA